jgi:hypothetical protein
MMEIGVESFEMVVVVVMRLEAGLLDGFGGFGEIVGSHY